MNNILKRFRKRNIQTNIHHFVLVILVVAVSMGLFIGLLINSMTLKNTIKTFYLNTNLPDVWVTSDKISQADETFYAEYFDYEKWMSVFEKCGIDPLFYTSRKRDYEEILPWDHLDYGIRKQFLISESKKAYESKTTPNCKEKCSGCGANKLGKELTWCPHRK